MRIITGTLKGRKIVIPKNVETRPTTDRTKEGLFNVIAARKSLKNARILDLFAGSGNLSFEAISRGAAHVTCVEQNTLCIKSITTTAEKFNVGTQVTTVGADVWTYIQGISSPYDFVFADPPYNYPYMVELIEQVIHHSWLTEEGWFILEHDARHDFTEHPHCVFSKPYGRTIVTIFLPQQVIQTEE